MPSSGAHFGPHFGIIFELRWVRFWAPLLHFGLHWEAPFGRFFGHPGPQGILILSAEYVYKALNARCRFQFFNCTWDSTFNEFGCTFCHDFINIFNAFLDAFRLILELHFRGFFETRDQQKNRFRVGHMCKNGYVAYVDFNFSLLRDAHFGCLNLIDF